jgi:hypothetical protein
MRFQGASGLGLRRLVKLPELIVCWSMGAIAQLGERIVRNDEAVGSIPTSSTKLEEPISKMMKTTNLYRWRRATLGGVSTVATVFLFATGAWGQASQCVKGKISAEDCWVGLEVSGNSVTVAPSDVALYSGAKLSWKRTDTPNPQDKPNFAVDFYDCTPFGGVIHFDQSSPAPAADQIPLSQFERCKYKVTIGNLTVDAEVIIIGGAKHQSTSWSRRHLGQW